MKKRTAWLALAWTLASRLAWAATGQPPALDVKVYAGPVAPSGRGKAIAIAVLIRNAGPARDATLQAYWAPTGGRTPFRSLALSLPAHSRRVVRFYTSAEPRYVRGSAISLVVRAGDDVASAEAGLVSRAGGIVIGKTAAALLSTLLPLIPPPVWALPDSHIAYHGVPVIFVGDAQLSDLSPAQVDAVKGYVFHGGALVVSAGVRGPALLQSFVADLLPGARCEVVKLDRLDGLTQRYHAPIEPKGPLPCAVLTGPGVVPSVLQGGVPIIATRSVGLGKVVWLGVDVCGPAFQGWSGLAGLWQSVSAPSRQGAPSAENLVHELEEIPAEPTPFAWILVYCVLYIACAGPGMFWILNRLKKPMAVWVCFPALAALFVALLPLLRAALAGAKSNLFVASLVECFPGENLARVRAVGVVFSRGREEHRLAFPEVKGSAMLGLRAPGPRLVHAKSEKAGVIAEPLKVDMWGRETFELEGVTARAPAVTGRCLDFGSGHVKFQITNGGDEPLPAGVFVCGEAGGKWVGRWIRPIEPGRTYEGEVLSVNSVNNVAVESFPWPALFLGARWRDFWPPGEVAAFVVRDHYGQNANAAQHTLDLFDQPSGLSELLWPTPRSDRYLETKVDCRTLVVWLPMARAAPRIGTIKYGEIQPKTYAASETSGPFNAGTIREFQVLTEPGGALLGLTVRVRYFEMKAAYRLQIYNYADQRWDNVALPRAVVHRKRRNRWDRNIYRQEAVVVGPERYVSQPSGVVTLRENIPPPPQQRYVGAYYRYSRYGRSAIAGGPRDRWVEVQATVKRPATR